MTPIPAAAVEAYVSAVNDYLAGLTHAQWNAQRNGPEALAHVARIGLTAALPHLSPARYFCSGPQGVFWTDDLELARALVDAYDKDDDWTVTDTHNPTGQEVDGGR